MPWRTPRGAVCRHRLQRGGADQPCPSAMLVRAVFLMYIDSWSSNFKKHFALVRPCVETAGFELVTNWLLVLKVSTSKCTITWVFRISLQITNKPLGHILGKNSVFAKIFNFSAFSHELQVTRKTRPPIPASHSTGRNRIEVGCAHGLACEIDKTSRALGAGHPSVTRVVVRVSLQLCVTR